MKMILSSSSDFQAVFRGLISAMEGDDRVLVDTNLQVLISNIDRASGALSGGVVTGDHLALVRRELHDCSFLWNHGKSSAALECAKRAAALWETASREKRQRLKMEPQETSPSTQTSMGKMTKLLKRGLRQTPKSADE